MYKTANLYYSKELHCIAMIHKLKDMVDIKHKKCNYKDCNTDQFFNNANKIMVVLNTKEEPNMIDVVNTNISCKQDHCSTRSSNPKYRGYCLRCFMYTFPDGNSEIINQRETCCGIH
jgi:hypothetical protein